MAQCMAYNGYSKLLAYVGYGISYVVPNFTWRECAPSKFFTRGMNSLARPEFPGRGNVWSLLPAFRGRRRNVGVTAN